MRHLLLLLLSVALLAGCSCQRQLQRLYRRCPGCFSSVSATADTLLHLQHPADNFAIPFPLPVVPDTIRGTHSSIVVNLAPGRDTLYITTQPDPDTVRVEIPVAVPCPDPSAAASRSPWPLVAALLLSTFFLFCSVHLLNTRRR